MLNLLGNLLKPKARIPYPSFGILRVISVNWPRSSTLSFWTRSDPRPLHARRGLTVIPQGVFITASLDLVFPPEYSPGTLRR